MKAFSSKWLYDKFKKLLKQEIVYLKNIVGFVFLFIFGSLLFLHTEAGRYQVRMILQESLSKAIEGTVCIDDVQYDLPRRLVAKHIAVTLPDGKQFIAASATLQRFSSGDMELAILDLKAAGSALSHLPKGLSANLFAQLSGNTVSWQGSIADYSHKLFKMEGQCQVLKTFGCPMAVDPKAPLRADISFAAEVSRYLYSIVSEKFFLSGNLQGNVVLSGSVDNPKIEGQGTFSNGYFESVVSGALLSSIAASFDIKDSKFLLRDLKGIDSAQGSITATGELELSSHFPFNFAVHCYRTTLIHLDLAEALFSGEGTFAGNSDGGSFVGALIADHIAIELPEQQARAVHAIDVAYINQDEKEALPTQPKKNTTKEWPLLLDIQLKNRNPISIAGNGLKSIWKGELHLSGSSAAPLIFGDCRIVEGEYLFGGKKWKLTEGTISFAGEPSKKTSLYVVVQHEIGDIVADVILRGPLSDLEVAFRSSPPLSQREILSWILFGRGLKEITPFQGAELSRSINKLGSSSSDSDSSSFLSRIKKSIGFIDRFEIVHEPGTADTAENVSLQVGTYILPRVFVGGKFGLTSKTNQLGIIEASLMENLKLRAEIGDHEQKQLQLKWKRDY